MITYNRGDFSRAIELSSALFHLLSYGFMCDAVGQDLVFIKGWIKPLGMAAGKCILIIQSLIRSNFQYKFRLSVFLPHF